MHLTPFTEAQPYEAAGHEKMIMHRLQGMEAGPSQSIWMGHSELLPDAYTTFSSSEVEKFYLCLDGSVEITTQLPGEPLQTIVLRPMDSCRIAPNEARQLRNRSHQTARLLLVMPQR